MIKRDVKNRLPLQYCLKPDCLEAGCDEAGRGCLAGPVFAAAVILPPDFRNEVLNDSKQLTESQRNELRLLIEENAVSFAVASCSPGEIDAMNILWASIEAMHRSLARLSTPPEHILVDGNRFRPYHAIPHTCIVRGDATYLSVAAASVLAKTYRDDYMKRLHEAFPEYGWASNKGYPTAIHREAIRQLGITPWHRRSFALMERQLTIDFSK